MKKNNTTTTAPEGKQDKGNGHTPGEWKFNKHDIGKYCGDIESELGKGKDGIMNIRSIAVVLNYCEENEAQANAKLIASAPQLKAENEKVKRLLHDLTLGGSEFYNDPEYCAKWIMEARELNHYSLTKTIKELKAENEKLKEDKRELVEALNNYENAFKSGKLSDLDKAREKSKSAISKHQ